MKPDFSIQAMAVIAMLSATLWLISGVDIVLAQTPSASVNSGAQAARGGSLASPAVFKNTIASNTSRILSLAPATARGNQSSGSVEQAQTSWGGMSASAPLLRNRRHPRNFSGDKGKLTQQNPAIETGQKSAEAAKDAANADDSQTYELLYENFHRTYRLGPGDEVAVRVKMQPDYTLERAKVSPDGRLFHPLTGDLAVGGLTVDQLTKRLKQDFTRYIREPEVSVHLLEAKSAKIGVLGEVGNPGILVMSEPMTVLDAIKQSGGFARTGKTSKVTLVRQNKTGRMQSYSINVKRILAGQADVEEDLPLQPGDTVIVHGNLLKKLEYVTASLGFTQFLTFLTLSRR